MEHVTQIMEHHYYYSNYGTQPLLFQNMGHSLIQIMGHLFKSWDTYLFKSWDTISYFSNYGTHQKPWHIHSK